MNVNLFLAFTKSQLIHVKNVIMTCNHSPNIIISRYPIDHELMLLSHRVFHINGSLMCTRKCWNLVLKSIDIYDEIDLYVAHSFNVLSQGLQHHIHNTGRLKSLNIFPDGNLLFNRYTVKYYDKDHFAKKIKSRLLSSEYRFFKGEIISPFYDVNTVYSYLPEVTCNHKKLTLLKMDVVDEKLTSGLLILGHRNQKVINRDKIIDVIKRNTNFDEVYYKPHPRITLSKDFFFKSLKSNFKVILISDDNPIESIIQHYPADIIFSVASSSLITLKLILPQVKICYFGVGEYLGNYYDPVIKNQFDSLGIIEWL